MPTPEGFGAELRHWRQLRGHTQQELAARSGYSQRHLSFLEGGRSAPSRMAVQVLAETLDMPARARHSLMIAAGFAPPLRGDQEGSESEVVLAAFQQVIEQHRPFPALIVDRAWNLRGANEPALRLFTHFSAGDWPSLDGVHPNVILTVLEPGPLRDCVEDWPQFANVMARLLRRDLLWDPDLPEVRELVERVESDPDFSRVGSGEEHPVLTFTLRRGEEHVSLFTMMSALNGPVGEVGENLRVETFLPADESSRQWLTQLSQDH